jgi:hypothetical protein
VNIFKRTIKLWNKPEGKILLGFFVLLLIFVIIILFGYYFKTSSTENNISSKTLGVINPDENEPQYMEMEEINSYIGYIKEIGKDYILFESEYVLNGNIILSTLRANLNDDTVFIKKDLAIIYKYGAEGEARAKSEIKKEDLEEGNQIIVYANENIKNKTKFTATQIEKIYRSQ